MLKKSVIHYMKLTLVLVLTTNISVVQAEAIITEGSWAGRVKCQGTSKIKNRGLVFRIDGDKAWLTNFGESGITYESVIKNKVVKFNGVYKGVFNGEAFRKNIRAKAKLLENGDVKITGIRGVKSACKGILKRVEQSNNNDLDIAKGDLEKMQNFEQKLPGNWKGKSGSLIKKGKNIEATFQSIDGMIVGTIAFDHCFPIMKLVATVTDNKLLLQGEDKGWSFSSQLTPEFGYVKDTLFYAPYRIETNVQGCPGSENGFVTLHRPIDRKMITFDMSVLSNIAT